MVRRRGSSESEMYVRDARLDAGGWAAQDPLLKPHRLAHIRHPPQSASTSVRLW